MNEKQIKSEVIKNKPTIKFESPRIWKGDGYNDPKKLTIAKLNNTIKDVTPTDIIVDNN
jgi:hypothetical protein